MNPQPINSSTSRVDPKPNPPKNSETSTRQLRLLDYRNGKYQGITSNDTLARNGLGIWRLYLNVGTLIDDNYSFILSEWKQNKI